MTIIENPDGENGYPLVVNCDPYRLTPAFRAALETAQGRSERDASRSPAWEDPAAAAVMAWLKLCRCITRPPDALGVSRRALRAEIPDVIAYLARAYGLLHE